MTDDAAAPQMHWEYAKFFWGGTDPRDRRQVWFSHRDGETFAPDEYDDAIWRLGEAGFELVSHQYLVETRYGDDPARPGPVGESILEVMMFKRPLGTTPTPPPHADHG